MSWMLVWAGQPADEPVGLLGFGLGGATLLIALVDAW
jgi:predicted dienelactone hydrolase